jgi:hypothetical protein
MFDSLPVSTREAKCRTSKCSTRKYVILIVYYCKLLIVGMGSVYGILWTRIAMILSEINQKEASVYAFRGAPPSLKGKAKIDRLDFGWKTGVGAKAPGVGAKTADVGGKTGNVGSSAGFQPAVKR